MVLCKRKLKFDMIDSWTDNAGRMAIAKIRMNGKNIAHISAYAPNAFDAAFYRLLTKALLDLTGFHLVLVDDFYAVWDRSMEKRVALRPETNVLHLRGCASGQPIQAWLIFGVC